MTEKVNLATVEKTSYQVWSVVESTFCSTQQGIVSPLLLFQFCITGHTVVSAESTAKNLSDSCKFGWHACNELQPWNELGKSYKCEVCVLVFEVMIEWVQSHISLTFSPTTVRQIWLPLKGTSWWHKCLWHIRYSLRYWSSVYTCDGMYRHPPVMEWEIVPLCCRTWHRRKMRTSWKLVKTCSIEWPTVLHYIHVHTCTQLTISSQSIAR